MCDHCPYCDSLAFAVGMQRVVGMTKKLPIIYLLIRTHTGNTEQKPVVRSNVNA